MNKAAFEGGVGFIDPVMGLGPSKQKQSMSKVGRTENMGQVRGGQQFGLVKACVGWRMFTERGF